MFEGPFGDLLGLSFGPRYEGGGGRRCCAEGGLDTVDDERRPPPRDALGGACERQRLEDLGARREGRGHGLDEAVFMLGACASFASYLWRKHVAGEPS